ncbi:MAG: TOBE domain-containing protein, partial [Tissierellia bacterium]|nr:TOBE domain-containing protein [Tissierellia bacterium]MDD4725156.1 TOBE domain-containing protein [Tissierellia bacterium]
QIGTPIDIYNEPKNAFVANFIGESNIILGIMHDDFVVEFSNIVFECVDKGFFKDELIEVVIRPEDIDIFPAGQGKLKGIVESVTFKGVHYEMIVRSNEMKWKIHSTIMKEVGTEIGMDILPENIHIMKKVIEE